MAQDFRNDLESATGTGAATLLTGANYDALIGIRCCNIVATTILVDVYITNSATNYYIAKNVSIPPNSAIELIQGGAKIVMKLGDVLYAKSDTASSLDIVTSYISQISSRLDKFVQKKDSLYNFRCPLCGDSKRSLSKARGFLYVRKGGFYYKCHNCGVGTTFANFLKDVDIILHKQYTVERWISGENGKSNYKKPEFIGHLLTNKIQLSTLC